LCSHFEQDTFRFYVYHGHQRERDPGKLAAYDIVFTTYETLVSDSKGGKSNGCLRDIQWLRIILDEGMIHHLASFCQVLTHRLSAHLIKEKATARFKAACALDGINRWCLTGTPIQNRIEDFAALLAFLRIKPFDQASAFKKFISDPLSRQESSAIPRLQKLVNAVSLRRTKTSVSAELSLTERVDHIESIEFFDDERQLYNFAKSQANDLLRRGNTPSGRCSSILQSILRLRQICNHGIELLPPKLRSKLQKGLEVTQGTKYHDLDNDCCESCGSEIPDGEFKNLHSRLFCPHVLCVTCSNGVAPPTKSKRSKKQKNSACPLCFPREPGEESLVIHEKIRPNNYQPSSKVQALLKNLASEGTNVKRFVTRPFSNFARITRAHIPHSVVFSGWTSMLDLVEVALEHKGSQFRRIDGSMSLPQRDKSLEDFHSKPECTVLLASIQSAGVG
jgi:SWI/SNF-related matrix-associated actin-dependent regulator of chromatin subfamily A3